MHSARASSGTQTTRQPVLGKGNSLDAKSATYIVTTRVINDSEIVYFVIQDFDRPMDLFVKCCVFCLFVKANSCDSVRSAYVGSR